MNIKDKALSIFSWIKDKKNNLSLGQNTAQELKTWNNYQDLINPYNVIFHPSYLETDTHLYDFKVLNDMSGRKKANYLRNILKYPRLTDVSLFFSPTDSQKTLDEYKKITRSLEMRIRKEEDEGRDAEKKLVAMLEEYRGIINNLEEWNDSYLNYSILFNTELEKEANNDNNSLFQEEREQVRKLFKNQVESPSKYYTPKGQIEEAYVSRLPLCEYRLKDWSNISASSGTILFPFFTETKTPSVKDWVPYGINRNTWELFFFNHSKLYEDWYITNRNMNVFWGTGAWKTSFFRSQIPLRMSYWDHFILFDPKRDYTSFAQDMWWQTIVFKLDKPIWYNIFFRNTKTYLVWWEETEIQSIEEKKSNLMRIMSIMCPYLNEKTAVAEFSTSILDSALSKVYDSVVDWEWMSIQTFYDKYLKETIKYFREKEPDKISNYTAAWERLLTNLWNFVVKEDGSKGRYYKMFLPVEKKDEIKLEDNPLITFDLYNLFKDDKIFAVACLIWMEFAWSQVATKQWAGTWKTIYIGIDENWKLLQYKEAAAYEENFSRLIRWLWGWIYTMSQNIKEYMSSKEGEQVLAQAQVNIILKLEPSEFTVLQKSFPAWFTEEIIEDFNKINATRHSYWQGYISYRWKMQPFKYLYLPSIKGRDSWQEKKVWQLNADKLEGYEVT